MKKLILAALIPAAIAGAAAPASAQAWHGNAHDRHDSGWQTPARNGDIRQQINGLRQQIDRAEQRRTISRREADGLRREARDIQRQYASFARRGLDRSEYRTLQRRVDDVRSHLRMERRDRDGHRG
ncbi:hypothetical protein OLX02_01840 [Novosphingobium sp. KCTC 2891]|uniref:hypothetical protein n=1 Tax=Novosphingobium sp. KCTC 2891 TaxID=2989730 RepID=UPI002222C791|nr:hypothetical protein [Novosphingobium sp. KCTC 2891]MCW1381555.1 hypothetical protein [Novosphingobium sp. KCTC 2891]